jgi:hypothetical protein
MEKLVDRKITFTKENEGITSQRKEKALDKQCRWEDLHLLGTKRHFPHRGK